MEFNKELSKRFGLNIFNSENKQFPYFVEEWDECFTLEEIEQYRRDELDFANIDTEQERTVEMPWDYGKHFE